MIEIIIGGVTAVQMKNGQIKLAGKGDRLEADPKNESYHVKNGHAVFVEATVNEDNAEVNSKANSEENSGAEPKPRKTERKKKADGEAEK